MKNIVFDLGGVVLDWNPRKVEANFQGNRALLRYLLDHDFFQQYWTEFDRGTYTEKEIIDLMSSLSGFPVEECRGLVEFVKFSLTDIPETVRLIRQLAEEGYSLYCLSNMSVEFYEYLKPREFFHYFKGQIISGIEKLVKPDMAIYRLLTTRFGLHPSETLFVDDLEKNVDVAQSMGFHVVHFADREKGYAGIREFIRTGK